ncbi:MAG: hypothetical protein AVDCRST_MAG88-1070, partial [uncultured Thermomicrobiales bacterium]
ERYSADGRGLARARRRRGRGDGGEGLWLGASSPWREAGGLVAWRD